MKPTILQLFSKNKSFFTAKKLLPLLILFTGWINAQTITIPNTYLKNYLLAATPSIQVAKDFNDQWMTIDTNNDGEIQTSEALLVKSLFINELLVMNTTGLEGFSNLESLTLTSCLITTLDTSSLTHLKSLSCIGMQILSTLNVNNNASLETLSCYNLPNLASLNINNLSGLSKLYCLNNGLTSLSLNGLSGLSEIIFIGNISMGTLTVNGLTNLSKLNCSSNNLAVLNLSGLTNLTELDCSSNQLTNLNGVPNVTKLNCSSNKLSALNLNNLTNLSELNCSYNDLTNLDIHALVNLTKLTSSNTKISTLSISNLPNLITLDCSRNNELTNVTLSNLPNLQEFSVWSNVTSTGDSLGNLTSLNLSGLPNLRILTCTYGKLTTLNLNGLANLKELYCGSNLLTTLDLTNLPALEKIDCSRNFISSIDATGLPNLLELTCGGGYIANGQFIAPFLTNLNVVGLSNLKLLNCSVNMLSNLDLTGLTSLETLYCDGPAGISGHISSLNVNNLTNLKKLSCSYQAITNLDVSNLVNLTDLHCSYNYITNLNLNGLINLKVLDYNYNQLTNLSLINLPNLQYLNCTHNHLTTLDVLNLTNLIQLNCSDNQLTTLNLSGLSSLVSLDFSYNQLSLANVNGISPNLGFLNCNSNNLNILDVSNFPNLTELHCGINQLTTLDVTSLSNLRYLSCDNNQLLSLNLGYLPHLENLECYNNSLTNIDLFGLNALYGFSCSNNLLTSLDLSNHPNLTNLDYSNNNLPNLDLSSLTGLKTLGFAATQTTAMDLSNMTNLESLACGFNQLTTIDVSHCTRLQYLTCQNNTLSTLFLKNGINESLLDFSGNPTLQYICADDNQLQSIQTQLNSLGMNGTVCNSYCSFTPGGNHNTITGITIFDANNDGCDVTDVVNPFIRLNVTDGSLNGATVTNINGTYNFYTDAGNYTIAPNTENPTWFAFDPASANFNFTNNNNNISTQNFCINAVGQHNDIEVVLTQIEPARPGFDARYKIVFKNKGNQMESGTVNFQFDDARIDFVSAGPVPDVVTTGLLSWNYTNLMPFENRSITVVLNINAPTETPAVNNGDILNFNTSITPISGDELPSDNQFTYNQTVVGSYDPNEITCLEGDSVAPTEIGNYLHYMVNFENTGTFYAENVVVRLDIDPTKFDMNSLQLLNSSNPSSTRISGNKVEFILQNINLEAAHGNPPVGGHGDVLFKIKTKGDLPVNDTVLQRAGIYFDYNFPVITNDATTTFAELNNPIHEFDNSVKIYPNPANSIININSQFGIQSVQLYDIQGRLLETLLENATNATIDISGKANGIYFLKIKTEKGSKVEKIVKE